MQKSYFLFLVLALLSVRCKNDQTKQSERNYTIKTPVMLEKEKANKQETEQVKTTLSYFFSNDTICEDLAISNIDKNSKDIPSKLQFKLSLHDNTNVLKDKILTGMATVTSQNESFTDEKDLDGGAYFAADYGFSTADYKIKIRLDIETFEACVVSIDDNSMKGLDGYLHFFKKYPKYDVLKQGNCK